MITLFLNKFWRLSPPEGDALATELKAHVTILKRLKRDEVYFLINKIRRISLENMSDRLRHSSVEFMIK